MRERSRDGRVIERVRKRFGLSCDSATATRERGRDERVIERVRKRPRVIFERGLNVCSKRCCIGGKKRGGTMPF